MEKYNNNVIIEPIIVSELKLRIFIGEQQTIYQVQNLFIVDS